MKTGHFHTILCCLAAAVGCTGSTLLHAQLQNEPGGEFWRRNTDGWFWYQEPAKEATASPLPLRPPTLPSAPKKQPEVISHEQLTKRADELLKIAFMNPSKANIEAYLRLQTLVVNKSSQFADVWQRVLWENPDLDFATQGRPVNAAAISVYERNLDQKKRSVIAELGRKHMLLFFFKSDCPYCHQFAPLLRNFAGTYGIDVFPVSMDGGGLPDFPQFRTDNGTAARLNVTHVPALFLVNPATNHIKPIGFGILSENELANRIYMIATQPDTDLHTATSAPLAELRRIP